jgi:membrane protein
MARRDEVAGRMGRRAGEDRGRRPGREADRPLQVPVRGWRQILVRAWKQSKDDNITMVAGSVAFFAFLAMFPGLIAVLTVYGLVADPAQARTQIREYTSALPQPSQQLVTEQLTELAQGSGGALSVSLVLSLLVALWIASTGTQNLMSAVNLAYNEPEDRGIVTLRALAVALTLGAAVFVLLALALVAAVPSALEALNLGPVGTVIAQAMRWLLLVALVAVALTIIYRVAPDRAAPRLRWVSVGALTATALWVLGNVAFSIFVNSFGRYNETYGTLAGVIVLMLWLYLTSYLVLLGAEINSEAERQTDQDTTRGEPRAQGHRGAVVADSEPAQLR